MNLKSIKNHQIFKVTNLKYIIKHLKKFQGQILKSLKVRNLVKKSRQITKKLLLQVRNLELDSKHFNIIGISIILITLLGLAIPFTKNWYQTKPLTIKKAKAKSNYLYTASSDQLTINIANKDTAYPTIEIKSVGSELRGSSEPSLSFTLSHLNQEKLEKPTKDGNKITYKNIKPYTDLVYQTIKNGIKEELILKAPPPAGPGPAGYQYTFDLTLTGDIHTNSITHGFESNTFYDADGNYLFHFEPPFAIDAAGNRTDNVSLQIRSVLAERQGRTLKDSSDDSHPKKPTHRAILTVDPNWLNHPDRVYPITIDPTVVHDTSSEFANTSASLNRATHSGDTGVDPIALVADDSTVGLWNLDETSGTRADSSKYNHTLTDNNTVTSATGKVSNAADFEEDNSEFLSIADNADLSTGDIDFTLSTWVYIESADGACTVVSKGDSDAQMEHTLILETNKFTFYFAYASGWRGTVSTPTTVSAGGWYHVVAWHDATANKVYIQLNNGVVNESATSGAGIDGAGSFRIGGYQSQAGYYWDGLIDEVGFWKRTLSAEERAALYSQRAIHTTYQELPADEHTVGLWHMNEGTDNTCSGGVNDICDDSGNSHDGAFTGDTTHTTSSKLGSHAITFDGTGDYINVGTASDFNFMHNSNAKWTVEAWTKWDSTNPEATYAIIGNNAATTTKTGVYFGFDDRSSETRDHKLQVTITKSSAANPVADLLTDDNVYPNDGEWHHVAATYDQSLGSNNLHIYVDGVEVGVASKTANAPVDTDATHALDIGSEGNASRIPDGIIDEVRISNIARTPEEIKAAASRRPYSVYTSNIIDLGAPVKSWTDVAWSENGVNTTDGETLADSTGLLAHYKFNETSGTTADNAEGTAARDGTLTNFASTSSQDQAAGTGWTANNKKWGTGGLMFDGTNDYIYASGMSPPTGDFTYEGWINLNTVNDEDIFMSSDGSGNNELDIFVADTLDVILNGTADVVLGNYVFKPDQWYHIAITRSGSAITTYINGKIDSTGSNGSTLNFGGCGLIIGADNDTSGCTDSMGNYTDGTIDSVRVYSRGLSASEVLQNYNTSNLELQTRVGRSSDPNDGTWEAWKDTAAETQVTNHEQLSPIQQISQTNLIAHWRLDETSGNRSDSEGSNTLTDNNTVLYGPGHLKNAADFEASNSEYLSITDNTDLSMGDIDFSITAWVKWESSPSSAGIVSKFVSSKEYILHYDASRFKFSVTPDGSAQTSVTANNFGAASANTWYQIIAWHDASANTINIQVNNTEADSTAYSSGVYDGTEQFVIGRYGTGGTYFDGSIDEVSVWKRTLTAAEKTQLYLDGLDSHTNPSSSLYQETDTTTFYEGSGAEKITTGAPQVDGNTVALWHLDETNGDNAGDDIFDETANNNDGEFNGSNVATAVVDGIHGKARDFNGTDDSISIPDSSDWTFGSDEFSISMWFNSSDTGSGDIFYHGDTSGNSRKLIRLQGSNTISVSFGNSTSSDVCYLSNSADTGYVNGVWNHIVIQKSGSNCAMYLNGAFIKSAAWSGTLADSSDSLYLGVNSEAGTTYYDGMLDEVKINKGVAYTAEEIAEAYRAGRDHYINKTITSDDLSGDTTLSYYVAADRPGTYMESMIGESPYANYQPDANTVGLWHLDEGTDDACNAGTNDACDASGTGNHGDEVGTTTPGLQGKLGKARDFDGSNDYINAGNDTSLDISDGITVDAWFNTNSSSTEILAFKGEGSASNHNRNFYIFLQADGDIYSDIGDGANEATAISSGVDYSDGNWHHVALTEDGTNIKLYVDGQLAASSSSSSVGSTSNTNDAYIGYLSSGYEFDGLIDEFRISNTARTASEIRQAYEVGRRTHPITIDFAASLDSGDLIADSSDKAFIIDSTTYGAEEKGDNLYPGDQVIVRETVDDTEYIAQATVSTVNRYSGEVNIGGSWTSGSTFPSSGYTANASVFKWQREYMDLSGPIDSHINATTNLTLRFTDGHQGRTVWLDDMNTSTGYASTNTGSTISSSTGYQFMQYRIINTSSDEAVSANLTDVTIDYVTRHPESHWKFDEGYGTTAYDQSTNGLNGSLGIGNTAPTWQQEDMCVDGKCLYFDGSNDTVTVSDNDQLDFGTTGDFSLFTWVRGSDSDGGVITKREPSTLEGYRIYVYNGKPYSVVDTTVTNCVQSESVAAINDNQWHHVGFVADRDSNVKFYTDGELVDTCSSATNDGTVSNDEDFKIGVDRNGSTYWDGSIDEPKIYSYARSADEVKADYYDGAVKIGEVDPNEALSEGLVGYWKMDETSANTCTGGVNDSCDSSGNGNDGAWTGNATNANGKFGNGVTFDGDGDYMTVTDANSLDVTQVTIAAWVNPNDITDTWGRVVDKANSYILHVTSGEVAQCNIYADASGDVGTASLTQNEWAHIVCTYDGENVRVYKNGVLQDTTARTGNIATTANNVYIGGNTGGTRDFNGELDETRIYNRALSDREVRQLYNFAPGPVGHWKFDENTGIVSTYDSSGNGNTGTMNGSMTEDDWVPGKHGSALEFDDTDDYIDVGNAAQGSLLDLTDSITMEAWVKSNESGTSGNGDIVGRDDSGTDRQYNIHISDTGGYAKVYLNGDTVIGNTNLNSSGTTWHHIAATWNKDIDGGLISLYVNGILENTGTRSTALTSYTEATEIGQREGSYFNGAIDDVRIYNYARSQKQVIEDMNAGHPAVGSPVGSAVGWWKFDEGADNTCSGGTNDACDSSPQGNDGALTGATWTNSGKIGKALDFDGSGDEVDLPSAVGLASQGTISMWFKADVTNDKDYMYVNAASGSEEIRMVMQSNNLNVNGYDNGAYQFNFDVPFTDTSNWHHVVFTFQSNDARIYLDGKLENSDSSVSMDISAFNNLAIGGMDGYTDGAGSDFDGKIDEVKIYNFALTQDEVLAEMNFGKAAVFGSLSTASDGTAADFSAAREYCIPGDTSTCNAPVGEWKFDKNTGTSTIYDTSSNSNNGTLTSITESSWVTGKHGSALDFDGSADYATVSDHSDLRFDSSTQDYTLEAWVKFPSTATGEDMIADKRDASDDGWRFQTVNDGRVECSIDAIDIQSTSSVEDNNWHHVVCVIDRDGNGQIYIDGVPDGSPVAISSEAMANTSSMTIGKASYVSGAYCDGSIDHISIYNYARTPAQIAWSYNRGKPIGWWRFDEDTGTTAYDASGNSNNGTLTNMDADTDWVAGKRNYALDFDGSNDYTAISDDSNLNPTNYISVSAWIKADIDNMGYGGIAGKMDKWATGDKDGWIIRVDNSDNLEFMTANNSSPNEHNYNISSYDDTWLHVVGVHDGTNNLLYVNGIQVSSVAGDYEPSPNPLYVGMYTWGSYADNDGGPYYFNGQIDDFRIFNYALTARQIQELYTGSAIRFGPASGAP